MKKFILLFTCFLFSKSFAQTIGLQSFASGFSSPVEIIHPPNDARLFIVQKGGLIRIVNPNGTINATPFLTVTGLSNSSNKVYLDWHFTPIMQLMDCFL